MRSPRPGTAEVAGAEDGRRIGITLFGVSCAKPKACIAVGSAAVARWQKVEWEGLALVEDTDVYRSVLERGLLSEGDCCLAVGTRDNHQTLAESWNGKKWRAAKALKP